MIQTFRDSETREIFDGVRSKQALRRLPLEVWERAQTKLDRLDTSEHLGQLNTPSNRLEKLRADREAQYSIRINRQYRICFRWVDGDALDVEITDYH